jgi:hypothetical protein
MTVKKSALKCLLASRNILGWSQKTFEFCGKIIHDVNDYHPRHEYFAWLFSIATRHTRPAQAVE